jgi:hypothetical protein
MSACLGWIKMSASAPKHGHLGLDRFQPFQQPLDA